MYAFEPTPLTISYLKKNIKLNNLSNIFVINKGLSSCKKQLPFLLSSNSEANHIISRNVENLEDRKNIIKIIPLALINFA